MPYPCVLGRVTNATKFKLRPRDWVTPVDLDTGKGEWSTLRLYEKVTASGSTERGVGEVWARGREGEGGRGWWSLGGRKGRQ